MRQPYENIYLGNFILTLGYIAGKRNLALNHTALQLLQQTPDDTTIGDLFANWGGRNFIFEFKRNETQVRSEFSKVRRTGLLAALHQPTPDAQMTLLLSSRCHFMCFPVQSSTSTLLFLPYAYIQNKASQDQNRCIDLSKFCTNILDGSADFGVSYQNFSAYLDVLTTITEEDSSGSGGAGVIMNISENGEISVVEVDNLRVLAKTLDHEPTPPTKTKDRSRGIER